MNKSGPIVIIEDSPDDTLFMTRIFKELDYKNEILFFDDGQKAFDFLVSTATEPFLILADILMPGLDGKQLRSKICLNKHLYEKCLPYLFFATNGHQDDVIEAYSKSIQGYFIT